MAPATVYRHEDFMREFQCVPRREFEFNGRVASWAPTETGPRCWDAEDESIDVSTEHPLASNGTQSTLALTSDERFFAVAINADIRIYDVANLRLCAELATRPRNVYSLDFRPRLSDVIEGVGTEYVLIATTTPHGTESEKLCLSKFKATDGSIDLEVPSPQLFAEGTLPAYGSAIWSSNESDMLYLSHTEAGGSEVVVFDAAQLREKCRLQGHRDRITSASWSRDGKLIATASWDGTYGIWVALSGVRRHTIATYGQNWHCSFLSDGARLLVSGASTDRKKNTINRIAIYSVDTAELVVSLHSPGEIILKPLPRLFAVHPSRDLVVVSKNLCLLAWTPFEMATNQTTNQESSAQFLLTLGAVESSGANRWAEFRIVRWIDEGRKLLVQSEDQTIFVWEPERRRKWRFQRSKGRAVDDGWETDVLFMRKKGAEWVLSMGEGRVMLSKL